MYLNQGRLNSIIGSQGKAVHGGLLPTQTTQRNKNVNVYRIKIYLLHWYFQQKQHTID